MKTKKKIRAPHFFMQVLVIALLAILMPFFLAADVLGASIFNFSGFYKIGIAILFFIATLVLWYQTRSVRNY